MKKNIRNPTFSPYSSAIISCIRSPLSRGSQAQQTPLPIDQSLKTFPCADVVPTERARYRNDIVGTLHHTVIYGDGICG
jgi:hypothetical protein